MKILIIFLLLSTAAQAGEIDEALRAEEAGDYVKAATLFLPLAQKGDPVAEYNLGVLYAQNRVIQRDYSLAMQWYLAAAEQGYAQAQTSLGMLYESGTGIPQDYQKALHWLTLAAMQRNATAQLQVGQMYAAGLGVPQDYREAVKWYRLASEQGNAIAHARLAECYAKGWGVAQNDAMAAKWYGTAANYASDEGQRNRYLASRTVLEKDIASRKTTEERVENEHKAVQTEAARIAAEQAAVSQAVEDAKLKLVAQAAFDARVRAQELNNVKKELDDVKKELTRVKADKERSRADQRSRLEAQMARRRAEINAEAARRRREILAEDRRAQAEKEALSKASKSEPTKTVAAAAKPEPVRARTAKTTQGAGNVMYPAKTELSDDELKHPLIRELQPPVGSLPGKPLIKIKQIEWSKKQNDS